MEQLILNIIRRWLWLLVLATLVAGLTAYGMSKQQSPTYEATARLIIGPGVDSPDPSLNDLRTGSQLMQTYAELVTTRPVLQAVIDDLNLSISLDRLDRNITVRSDSETQILSIDVQDGDPAQAAAIANAIAGMLVGLGPSGASGPKAQLRAQMHSQAEKIEESIASSETRIEQLEGDLKATTEAETQRLTGDRIVQESVASTEARIKQLEAELQAATDVDRQRLISNQILQETISTSEARIKQLEADFQAATEVDRQRQLLDQIGQERSHLSDLERADVERQRRLLDQILQESIASTEARIKQLETNLKAATEVDRQRSINDQLSEERKRLSDLESADVERQRRLLGQILQENVASAEEKVRQLEAELQAATDVDSQRQLLNRIAQERKRLFDGERTGVEKQRQILDQMLQVSIVSTEATIKQLQTQLPVAIEVETQRMILDQLSQERSHLSNAQLALAQLYDALQKPLTNQIKIIEPAILGKPVDSQLKLRVLIAGLAGLVLALTIALAFEYFDNTVKTEEDLTQATDVPVLGAIARHKPLRGIGGERLIVQALPESQAAENYRMLGTKLLLSRYKTKHAYHRVLAENQDAQGIEQLLSNGGYPLRSVLVSSSQVSDDASETAANLAVVLAQAGRRVILVNAYLHRSVLDQMFGLTDQIGGLTNVLTEQSPTLELTAVNWAPGLSILPSGPVSPNPFELLASTRMADLIEELESRADMVIIAASPLLSFADSLILASYVDGVVIVAHSGQTRREIIGDVVESLRSFDAHIIGTVFDHNYSGDLFFPSPGRLHRSQWQAINRLLRVRWPARPEVSSPRKGSQPS